MLTGVRAVMPEICQPDHKHRLLIKRKCDVDAECKVPLGPVG